MKKIAITALVVLTTLVGCSDKQLEKTTNSGVTLNKTDLMHHHWLLESINGERVQVPTGETQPSIEIGEHFSVNGFNGCNRYFGQGELNGAQFRIDQMASTMMSCAEAASNIERIMADVLGNWSKMTLSKEGLQLQNANYTLYFKLRDWVV
ncbi:MAG: META domain-containing protein [Vibrionaceae bacterium]